MDPLGIDKAMQQLAALEQRIEVLEKTVAGQANALISRFDGASLTLKLAPEK